MISINHKKKTISKSYPVQQIQTFHLCHVYRSNDSALPRFQARKISDDYSAKSRKQAKAL